MTVMRVDAGAADRDDRPTTGVRPVRALPEGVDDGLLDGAGGGLARLAVHLTLAALPLLAISAHVFGVLPMHLTAALVVLPLTVATGLLVVFDPLIEERIVLRGAVWGLIATLVYDAFRLDTVYLLRWWGDFIPTMGTWVLGADPDATAAGAVAGYLWRYAGDGPGIGVVFFVLAAATGLRRLGRWPVVGAAVAFAVFPVWTGLVATVGLAPDGEEQMFALTPTTVTLSLVGHLIFGLVLGLGCARTRDLERDWPYPPLLDLERLSAALRGDPVPATPVPALPRPPHASPGASPAALPAGGDVVRGGRSRAGGALPTWGPQTGGHRVDGARVVVPAPRARPDWWDAFDTAVEPLAPLPRAVEMTMPVPPPRGPVTPPGGVRVVPAGRPPRH